MVNNNYEILNSICEVKHWNNAIVLHYSELPKLDFFEDFSATIDHIYLLIIVAEADSNLAQVIIFWIRFSQYLVRYLGKFEMEILKYVVVLRHILEKVLYNPGIPVFIILERHCNIVKWYYHMPRVSQLIGELIRSVEKNVWMSDKSWEPGMY